jgi:hypothetical protein
MRIISNFKDYYDGCKSMDREDQPVYVRREEVFAEGECSGSLAYFEGKTIKYRAGRWGPRVQAIAGCATQVLGSMPGSSFIPHCEQAIVGCCGKLYPFYRVQINQGGLTPRYRVAKTLPDLLALVASGDPLGGVVGIDRKRARDTAKLLLDEKTWQAASQREKQRLWRPRVNYSTPKEWRQWLKKNEVTLQSEHHPAFVKAGSPLFLLSGRAGARRITLNPRLGGMDFARIVPPPTMWQELDMYLGSHLVQREDPDSAWTNEGAIQAHGFDEESFRRQSPGARKSRRRDKK